MKSLFSINLFFAMLVVTSLAARGQEADLPDEVKAAMANVDSWEVENREAVLASLGESNQMMRGDWQDDMSVTFGSELAAFDAISLPTGIELTWVTTSEFGSEVFAVERMLEDGRFATITLVEAEGVSNRLKVYRYLDRRTDGIPQTYRLRQIDQNGSTHISHALNVFPYTDRLAVLTPDISENTIQLPLESRIVKITVWNSDGEQIVSIESWEEGIQEIETDGWETGSYAIHMETESGRRSAMIALP